jgi:hypothetical protein
MTYQITLTSHENTSNALEVLSQSQDSSYELLLEEEALFIRSMDINLILNLSRFVRLALEVCMFSPAPLLQ